MSERYGYRMLPVEIPEAEFDLITNEFVRHKRDTYFHASLIENESLKKIVNDLNVSLDLMQCYSKNRNKLPHCYQLNDLIRLLPESDAFSGSYKDIEWEIKLQLHNLLRKTVQEIGSFTRLQQDRYFISSLLLLTYYSNFVYDIHF